MPVAVLAAQTVQIELLRACFSTSRLRICESRRMRCQNDPSIGQRSFFLETVSFGVKPALIRRMGGRPTRASDRMPACAISKASLSLRRSGPESVAECTKNYRVARECCLERVLDMRQRMWRVHFRFDAYPAAIDMSECLKTVATSHDQGRSDSEAQQCWSGVSNLDLSPFGVIRLVRRRPNHGSANRVLSELRGMN